VDNRPPVEADWKVWAGSNDDSGGPKGVLDMSQ
jgi:hypothetical protein